MAFDGITLKNIIYELGELTNGKVDSIYEPTDNSLIIKIYKKKLFCINIDTSATNYRIHLTTHLKKNPMTAPNFCMLLRKHLVGSQITKIYMDDLERICYIDFECFDNESGKKTKTLIIELMGKYSNIILVNDKNIIIDALKKYNCDDVSRSIIPSKRYFLPQSKKISIINSSIDKFKQIINESDFKTLDTAIPNLFTGISKAFIQCAIDKLHISNTIANNHLDEIYNYILLVLKNDNKSLAIKFKNGYSIIQDNNNSDSFQINFFLDDFYFTKTETETYLSYRNNLLKILESTLNKLSNKMNNINEKIKECENMDQYKTNGELLIANIYKLNNVKLKESYVIIENYYNNNQKIKIIVDSSLSISQNAERYFKKYNKLKNTLSVVEIQKEQTNKELNYLESLIQSLDNCKTIEDVDEVYNEISQNILFNNLKSKKQSHKNKKNDISMLNNYIKTNIDGFDVLVGKNNKQNDYITLKVANDNDIWFHAKEIHGSHLVLRCNGETPKISTIKKCAQICAYYSKAKYSSHVPVDYTRVKCVKKPHGANPGFVIYTNNKTIYVDPSI